MKHALCAVLLFALPAVATISQRQSPVSQWNSSPQSSCYGTSGSGYHSGDLIVVWTYWSTGSSSNSLTASVTDHNNPNSSWISAVGPTLQLASNAAAQIFYVASTAGSGSDLVTVAYSGSATTSGCVFVEYQGADTVAPLDSVSEAISNSGSPSNALDSGTSSPANANLLVFGAGVVDNTSGLLAGSGFTSVQSSPIW